MKDFIAKMRDPKNQSNVPRSKIGPAYYMWKFLLDPKFANRKYTAGSDDVKVNAGVKNDKVPAPSETNPKQKSPFPKAWGKPPAMPYNLVDLPKPYKGVGSPELAKWIRSKQRR